MTEELNRFARIKSLKPCPFCGGKPKRVATQLDERVSYAIEVAYVCKCGCRRAARGDCSKGGYADNSKVEDLALSAWNTRALTQRPAAQTEREYPYGYCPECGAPGLTRERRPDGDDKCSNGHRYPSRSAHTSLPAAQQATPEPVGEAIIGRWLYEKWWAEYGKLADVDKPYYTFDELPEKQRAAYESLALVLTRPAPGVPEGFALAQAEFNRAIDFAIKEGIGAAIFLDAWRHEDTSEWPEFAAAQAKGGEA